MMCVRFSFCEQQFEVGIYVLGAYNTLNVLRYRSLNFANRMSTQLSLDISDRSEGALHTVRVACARYSHFLFQIGGVRAVAIHPLWHLELKR